MASVDDLVDGCLEGEVLLAVIEDLRPKELKRADVHVEAQIAKADHWETGEGKEGDSSASFSSRRSGASFKSQERLSILQPATPGTDKISSQFSTPRADSIWTMGATKHQRRERVRHENTLSLVREDRRVEEWIAS
jgi:hypothetical protein